MRGPGRSISPYSETLEGDADPSIIWEGHKAGRERGYCQIEKLGNLEQLPGSGFDVICFPTKIKVRREAGPAP